MGLNVGLNVGLSLGSSMGSIIAMEDLARLGRLHPLVLHLPIGFLLAALVLELAATRRAVTRPFLGGFLWIAALSAVLAATTGWVLSREEGYGGETLEQHERLGIALAVAALLVALLHDARERSALRLSLYRAVLGLACVLLVPTGHLGSTMTHGADWLQGPRTQPSAPLPAEPPALSAGAPGEGAEEPVGAGETDEASAASETYALTIAPILAERCTSCHGETKRKGGLRLDSPAALLAGGDSGAALVPGEPEQSLFLVRARLPLEHEDHMPPEGKPQPTAEELAALEAWVAEGAPFGSAAGATEPEVGAREAPSAPVAPSAPESARRAPDEPPPEALAALEAAFVHHERSGAGLRVDVAAVAKGFGDEELARLVVPLAPWITELALARSRVGDASLAELAGFPRLVSLDLRATAVGAAGLAALGAHPTLERLNLAQTALDEAALEPLLRLPALRRLELWNAGLSGEALARLRARAGLEVEAGDEPPPEVLEAEGELAFSSDRPLPGAELVPEGLRPINATCPVSGSPVNPKYALVHAFEDGAKVVGFCCPNCPKEFWADPARFVPKLP